MNPDRPGQPVNSHLAGPWPPGGRPTHPSPEAGAPLGQLFRFGCGTILALSGAVMTLLMLLVLGDAKDLVIKLVVLGLFGLLPLLFGGLLLRSFTRQLRARREQQAEQRLLELASQRQGVVTVEEAAHRLHNTLDQTRARLDTLVRQGHATLDLTETGALVYRFPGFVPEPPAATSETAGQEHAPVDLGKG